MNNQETVRETVQGIEPDKEVTLSNIEKWLEDDIRRSLGLLNALNQDKDLRKQMAVWMKGRIDNAKLKHNQDQMDLFNANGPKATA